MTLIENWKKTLDQKGFGGAILMDLSKAFDTLNHELLLAKLNAYGYDKNSLKIIHSYLSDRYFRTKINGKFSSWGETFQGVPQGSVLGPLLFNIYLNDLFYVIDLTQVCNFADDTTFFACDKNLASLLKRLEHDSLLAIEWFHNNYMKLNQDKCHLLVAGHKHETVWAEVGEAKIWESNKEKLLGITIDRRLNFDDHVFSLCKKSSQKLSVLARISNYMSFDKKRILFKAFVESQFAYLPLIWMFHGRKANSKINHIHERALRVVYEDNCSSFEELLKKDGSFKIHQKNIQSLAIELYKVKNNQSNTIMNEIFELRNVSYNLRSQTDFDSGLARTNSFGIDSLKYMAAKVWDMVPNDIKNVDSLHIFKSKIRKWEPLNCHCKLCLNYVPELGYINVAL